VLGGARAAAARIPFTAREIPAGVMQWGKNTLKAGGLGAVQGAGDAPDVAGIPSGMTMGGILGAGVGGVVAPVVAAGAGPAARLLQVNRLRDPEKIATEQIAKVARDAGVSSEQIMREVADANAAGQPYAVVDTLGKAGERKLAAMAKVPGAQRDLITEQITTRDLNMPVRTGAEVGRGLGAPGTSEAAREALIERARAEAAPLYRQAEQHPTWSNRLQDIIDDPIARQGLRHGVEIQRLEAVGQGRPFNPRDLMITDFDAAGDPIITGVPNVRTLHTLKVGLDRMIEGEVNPATGALNARGRALDQYRRGLLAEMDAINPTYAEARRVYGGPMRIAQATRVGETMPFAGRWEDTMRAFGDLPPTEQQGVRIGYANAVRDPLERTGNFPTILREKSQKGMNELEGLSLYQGPRRPDEPDQLRKFLDREERMQRVSKAALGGPQTAENLADMGAGPGGLETALGLAHAAATGNPLSIAGKAMGIARQIGMGENEAQRMAISRALLAREPDAVRAMAARIAEHERRRAEAEAVRASGFRSPFGAARP